MELAQSEIAAHIAQRIREQQTAMQSQWESSNPVRHCYVDDLLPEPWAQAMYKALPDPASLQLRETDKERKRVGIALEKYHPLMRRILLAFQEQHVVAAVAEITSQQGLQPDPSLYGSGISMMLEGDFLLPHLDNSHDGDGRLYRVLNLLYYISPGWPEDAGGNLELWDKSMKQRTELHARFNRLILMETNPTSLHSVKKVKQRGGVRACISNYYFSAKPPDEKGYVHKTTFFARPEDSTAKKLKLRLEGNAKNLLSKFLGNKVRGTKHRRK